MRMTATELRRRFFQVLDRIAETGESVEIVQKGRTFRIAVEERPPLSFSSERLVSHPGTILGDAEDLIRVDWSKEN